MKKVDNNVASATLEQKYPNTYKVLAQDEDVTMQDIVNDMRSAGLTVDDLPLMEAALNIFPEYANGLPFPDALYEQRLASNTGLQLLQKFMEFWG